MNYSTTSGGPRGPYRKLNNIPSHQQRHHHSQQNQQQYTQQQLQHQQNLQHIMQQHHHHQQQQAQHLQQSQGQLPMRSNMPHHQLPRATSGASGLVGGVGGGVVGGGGGVGGGPGVGGPGGAVPTSSATSRTNSIPQPALMALNSILTLGPFKHRKDLTRESVLSTYQIMGYIAAGTYGKVYKAKLKNDKPNGSMNNNGSSTDDNGNDMLDESIVSPEINLGNGANGNAINNGNAGALPQFYAIKKFKSDNHHHHGNNNGRAGGNNSNNNTVNNLNKNQNQNNQNSIHQDEVLHYTGISQSAIREMSLCRELNNKNITKLVDIILENKSIYMVFEFCEHDLLQIIHYQSHPEFKPIPNSTIKSLIWQILNGVTFLHKNWIFHRDLKPANIMVTSQGVVKIGDLGLARKFKDPLQSLYTGDKVVVTIWYRAPELLLGTRHYTPALDLWAIGCILGEILSLRPMFKGEECKIDLNNKKSVPFQKNQLQKIVEILGTPTTDIWPSLNKYPEYLSFTQNFNQNYINNLSNWFKMINGGNNNNSSTSSSTSTSSTANCLDLLAGLLKYDPEQRLTADQALLHPYFLELPKVTENAFEGLTYKFPNRKIYTDDNDIVTGGGGGNANHHHHQQVQQQQGQQGQQSQQLQSGGPIQIQQVQQLQQQIQSQQLQGYKRGGMDDLSGGIRKKRG
ncbi:Serine/threonine-protein kinase SSN3 [Candida viswanathii]|uniref:Cyclin-dependent kinase 8 n=1 Tax=Candida viswanathii TaxID=5486 RepID=A0A367XLQ9_9ASCO|nr:Serine/threonine-protein kinase SSN3 [Candida viswanathii]